MHDMLKNLYLSTKSLKKTRSSVFVKFSPNVGLYLQVESYSCNFQEDT